MNFTGRNAGALACNAARGVIAEARTFVRAVRTPQPMSVPPAVAGGDFLSATLKPAVIKQSAGLLVYRETDAGVEVFLVHPGGPFWAKKDDGVWSIPKGEFDGEDSLTAARREFEEETGQKIAGDFFALTPIKQKAGKIVYAWAVEADIDAEAIHSNTFEMEWPPRSGKTATFPEIDRAAWFDPETAIQKINSAQAALVNELLTRI